MSAAKAILDGLILANELAYTAEQIGTLFNRVQNGDVPSEEELDALHEANQRRGQAILDRIEN